MKNKKTFYLLWVLGGLPLFLYPMVLFMGFIFLVALPQWNFSAQARIENILFIITESRNRSIDLFALLRKPIIFILKIICLNKRQTSAKKSLLIKGGSWGKYKNCKEIGKSKYFIQCFLSKLHFLF